MKKKRNKKSIIVPDAEGTIKAIQRGLTNVGSPYKATPAVTGDKAGGTGLAEDFEYNISEDLKPLLKGTEFVYMNRFNKKCKDLKVTDDDLVDLENQLTERAPDADLGAGVFKFR